MILDLHNHSIKSDDGRAKVENYCKWIVNRDLDLDGFVLSEHRQWDATSDYRALEDQYDLLILKASEVETEYGHVLVFGVNEDLQHAFDFTNVHIPLEVVLRESKRCGAFAVPCHPGRAIVGMFSHFDELGEAPGVEVVETLNGGGRGTENSDAIRMAQVYGYRGIGGSDAHIVSHIGRCVTEFEDEIKSIEGLVSSLAGDRYQARSVEPA